MFDVKHESKIEIAHTPEAATATPPVRVEFCGKVVWLRPSNVLRIEVDKGTGGYPKGVLIVLSDGKNCWFANATTETADSIAALLWPKT